MSAPRYKVVAGSQSGHCCFDYTVVDTTRPYLIHGAQYEGRFEAVCETFDQAEADLVCAALNAYVATAGGAA
jgi:hypothetical protein